MKHFNRKIKYAILALFICLLALISFSNAGILFSANNSSDIITVSTQKKSFNPKVIPEKVELTYNGETLTQNEWAKKLDIYAGAIQWRLKKGWSVEEALSTPVKYGQRIKKFRKENN